MIVKISRLNQTVNDASICIENCAQDLLALINRIEKSGYIDVDGLNELLVKSGYINDWANKLALLFLKIGDND